MRRIFHSRSTDFRFLLVLVIAALGLSDAGTRPARSLSRARTGSDAAAKHRVLDEYSRLPLRFEKNEGQTDSRVSFTSRGRGYALFLLDGGQAVLTLSSGKTRTISRPPAPIRSPIDKKHETAAVLRLKLIGANGKARAEGRERLPGTVSYLLGNDQNRWHTGISTFAHVAYNQVYRDIDLVYYGNQHQLEYDFVVRPGGDPRAIAFEVEGADSLHVDVAGDLVMRVGTREIRQRKPVIYQEAFGVRREVNGGFELQDSHVVKFQIAEYDPKVSLVIDPTLVYSTYLGGSSDDFNFVDSIAVDASGSAYVTGYTNSADFPSTPGAFDSSFNGGFYDVFVSKLNATGSALDYSTYLGGSNDDISGGIAVDALGSAYVTGYTNSDDFPTTAGAFDTSFNGGSADAFVTKLNPAGSAPLVYSTYLGGGDFESGYAIAVDASGSAYVTGYTYSANFPTTAGAFDTSFNGSPTDAFVTRLNPAGSAPLVYSTYLGGTGDEIGFGITVDVSEAAYVAGYTSSTDFPTTAGAFDTSFNGSFTDAFVTKLNPAGSEPLLYSTYLGGTGDDVGFSIAVDASNGAYVSGYTNSTDFPTTPGAFDTSFNGVYDAFVTNLNRTGSAPLVYSTYLGGSDVEVAYGIAVDASGSAYVTGSTNSADFPTTPDGFDILSGSDDAFVTKLNPAGSAPLGYSTYLGGVDTDIASAVAVDVSGSAYVAGYTYSGDFPTTSGAFDTTPNGFADVFVLKIVAAGLPAKLLLSPAADTNTVGDEHCVTATVTDATGNPVPNMTVRFSVIGANSASGSATTDANGKATFCYTGTNAGVDAISAYADSDDDETQDVGEPSGAASKTYTPGAPATLVVTPPTDTNTAGDTHCVTATVRDAFGNPVPGVIVRFSVSGANSASESATTNAAGEATFCYTGTHAGLDTISAFADTDNDSTQDAGEPVGAATKDYVAGALATLTLNPPAATNPVDTRHCVTATVRDLFGNPTPGVVVRFTVTGSVSSSGSETTNAAGQATFCYMGPPLPGADRIRAYADTDMDNVQDPGEPTGVAGKTWVLPETTPLCQITVTNGGWIVAANGDRASFGGNARLSETGEARGQEQYRDHGPAQPMRVHSINVQAIVCDGPGSEASIYGQATINGSGSFFYRIKLKDRGEPGAGADTYWLLLQTGYTSLEQVLKGGNVQIRRR